MAAVWASILTHHMNQHTHLPPQPTSMATTPSPHSTVSQGCAFARRGGKTTKTTVVLGLSYRDHRAQLQQQARQSTHQPGGANKEARRPASRRSRRAGRKHRKSTASGAVPQADTATHAVLAARDEPQRTDEQTTPPAAGEAVPGLSAAASVLCWPLGDADNVGDRAGHGTNDTASESGDSRALSIASAAHDVALASTVARLEANLAAHDAALEGAHKIIEQLLERQSKLEALVQDQDQKLQQLGRDRELGELVEQQAERLRQLEATVASLSSATQPAPLRVGCHNLAVASQGAQDRATSAGGAAHSEAATGAAAMQHATSTGRVCKDDPPAPRAAGWLGRGQAKRRESQHNVAPRVVDGDASCDAPLQPPQPPRQATVADEAKHEAPQCTDSWGDVSDHPACDIGLNARSSPSADKAAAATVLDRDEGNNGGLCFGTTLTALDSVASFHAMGLSGQLLRGVETLGFSAPSRVQQLATKPMIDGRDTIAQAPAGQGKTGAFAVGSLARVDVARRELQVVVVSPSKELCKQTADVYRTLGQHMGTSAAVRSSRFRESPTGVRVEAFIGGVQSVGDNLRALRRSPHVVVACAGRLCQLVREKLIDMSRVRVVVLDEADALVEGSQAQDVACIIRAAPSRAQVAIFSATMPDDAVDIAREFMTNPAVLLSRGSECAGSNVTHSYVMVETSDEYSAGVRRLASRLKASAGQAMVFVRRRGDAVEVARALYDEGVEAVDAVHSGVDREAQQHAIDAFKRGTCRVLVCTDMLARGINVPAVSTVINVGLPSVLTRYVHRAGRCGRHNRRGECISVVSRRSLPTLRELEDRFGASIASFRG